MRRRSGIIALHEAARARPLDPEISTIDPGNRTWTHGDGDPRVLGEIDPSFDGTFLRGGSRRGPRARRADLAGGSDAPARYLCGGGAEAFPGSAIPRPAGFFRDRKVPGGSLASGPCGMGRRGPGHPIAGSAQT